MAGLGHERPANLAAERGADRDVLQIRIAAAQASRSGHRLVEDRVHAPSHRMDQRGQGVDVGALQLRQAAPVEDQARQVVREGQVFQHLDRRGRRARRAGALQHRQFQLLEEHLAELLGRADVEGFAGLRVNLGGERAHLLFHVGGLARERLGVDAHADAFECRQDRHERQLEVAVDRGHAGRVELGREQLRQLPREIRAFAGVVEQAVGRERREGHGLGALAAHVVGEPRAIAELLERQRFQVLARARGVEQVGRQHRVEIEPGQGDAVARQDDGGELQVVAHLGHRGIFEHGFQDGERAVTIEPAVVHERHRAKRQEAGGARPRGAHQTRQRGAHAGLAVGQRVQGYASARADLVDERPHAVERLDYRVVGGDRFGRGRVVGHQRAEAEVREERVAAVARHAAIGEGLGIERHRHVDTDRDQLAAAPGVVGMGQQRLALLLRLHLASRGQQRVERAVGGNQIARALLADARYALHVVGGIAHQRQHVDHLPGPHAELRRHALGVEPGAVVFRVVDADVPAHQLVEILVAGDDRHAEAGVGRLPRQRADHVVGFEAFARQNRHAHGFAGFVHPRNLLGQVRRHRRAVGLVVGGDRIAEGGRLQVERRGDVGRPVVGHELAQHGDEAVDRVGRAAVGAGQPADRVVGAIHLVAAVDEEKRPRVCHGARPVL